MPNRLDSKKDLTNRLEKYFFSYTKHNKIRIVGSFSRTLRVFLYPTRVYERMLANVKLALKVMIMVRYFFG